MKIDELPLIVPNDLNDREELCFSDASGGYTRHLMNLHRAASLVHLQQPQTSCHRGVISLVMWFFHHHHHRRGLE